MRYWTPETFETSTYRWGLSERKSKTYTTSGSDNTGKCIYTYNSLGFRGDEPTKKGFKVMCIGDSNTEGVGVNNNQTWPFKISELIKDSVNHNFGMGGRSNDYIARCLLTYYDLIKPDLVLIMYTALNRREIYTAKNNIEPYIATGCWGYLAETEDGRNIQTKMTELQNDNEDFINWYKNHSLIKYFLESKKCNWLWNGWMDVPGDYQEFNRFDGDYGLPFLDLGVENAHPGPVHNSTYSAKLYSYLHKNFREYLPDGCNALEKTLI